ncbi:MAG: PEP-CTERM sorting domain-containing protein [Planctomycetota bacterium]|nr:MAG: PEP-CTERM sorting domain-containing protein [Planctomycetota bacterium]REK24825.1 MAG: PEP-CTERM sorting domain-containing protein [Planctomycetota bacterium]REK49417.1 MAG: PEP-CTERM sorting domain-containing protein [Planctomycetota bacterium]
MKRTTGILAGFLLLVGFCSTAAAQHSDIEFEYSGSKIVFENGEFGGTIFESEFPTTGADQQFTDDPGIASELAEGLGINPGDEIYYNILGPLEFWDPIAEGFGSLPAGVQIRIENTPPTVPDTIVDASTVSIPANLTTGQNRIGEAEPDGDFHGHVDFFLEPLGPTPPVGAYAISMSLLTDAIGIDDSDPFRIVFNYGLEEEVFEEAVAAFAAPEPSTWAMAALALVGLLTRRKWMPRRSRRTAS